MDDRIASQERYERFVRGIADAGEVWGLKSEEGWCLSPSNGDEGEDEVEVMPFWSDRARAAQCAIEEWEDYEPTSIPLDLFIEEWLPGMVEDGFLAGANWNADLLGIEVDPMDLKEELERRLADVS